MVQLGWSLESEETKCTEMSNEFLLCNGAKVDDCFSHLHFLLSC